MPRSIRHYAAWRCGCFMEYMLKGPKKRRCSFMKLIHKNILFALCILLIEVGILAAQEPVKVVPVQITITASGKKGADFSSVTQPNVMVFAGKQRLKVSSLAPVSKRSIVVMVDEGMGEARYGQIQDLRDFILKLPAQTEVMVCYASNSTTQTVQDFTSDLNQAASAVRLPIGSISPSSSIYRSLRDFLARWK